MVPVQYAGSAPVGADAFGSIDVGIGVPKPDRGALPSDIRSGEYRVCTASAWDELCAPLTIVASSLSGIRLDRHR